ncbi:MAG: hypothetical protein OEZ68_09315 [Gammaproteobacteria bacterium]|nr:hypothetical protein [Gammaproteobacteria bacterium]MDH5800987.1 hypothetical protein [Gammaproteobacteria bacterium]
MKLSQGRFAVVCYIATLFTLSTLSTQAAILKVNNSDLDCNDTRTGLPADTPYCNVASAFTDAVDGDEIQVSPGVYRTNISSTKAIVITGSGPGATVLDGGDSTRIFLASQSLTLSNLSLTNGHAKSSGAGGAIRISGTTQVAVLTIDNVVFYNNQATIGGAIATAGNNVIVNINNSQFQNNSATRFGGAIYYYGDSNSTQSLQINNSSFSNNQVTDNNRANQGGGALYNMGNASVSNTTFSGNSASHGTGQVNGGAINNQATGILTLHSSTIADNQSTMGTGGIYNLGNLTLSNSILANNSVNASPANCNSISSAGYNLIGDTTNCTLNGSDTTDISNATAVQLGIGPLANNGGPGLSHALNSGSAAIDSGSCTLLYDQRGAQRSGTCDRGAYEATTTPDILVYPAQGIITTEAGHTVTLSVVLSAPPSAVVQLNIASSLPSEISVSPTTLTFTSTNWNTVQTLSLSGQTDNLTDADQPVQISLSDGALSASVTATNWNVNNVASPGFTIRAPDQLITTEQSQTAHFFIKLTSRPTIGTQVAITARITGINADEASISVTLPIIFNADNWNFEQPISVQGIDDTIVDGNQEYQLEFLLETDNTLTTDAIYQNAGIATQNFTMINLDNDLPNGETMGVTVTQPTITETSENGAETSFQVQLRSQPTANVTLNMLSNLPGEGNISNPPSAQLIFTPTNWASPQTVTVRGQDDNYVDGNRPYSILFDSPQSTDLVYSLAVIDRIDLTNIDNETPGMMVTAGTALITNETGSSVDIQVELTSPPRPGTVVVVSTNYDTTEHQVSPESITFTDTNWGQQTFTITGLDDATRDGDVVDSISVFVSNTSTNGPYHNSGLQETVLVTNIDNGSVANPGITVTAPAQLQTSEDGTTDTFTVALQTQPATNVVITVQSSDPTEGTVNTNNSLNLTFTPSNWSTPQTVTITGASDGDSVDVNYQIQFLVSGDPSYAGMQVAPIPAINIDVSSAIIVTPTGGLVTTEEGATATIEIFLEKAPLGGNVYIDVSSSDITEARVLDNGSGSYVQTTRLTFNPSNYNTPQQVTVRGEDDFSPDGDISYQVQISSSSSNDSSYDLGNVHSISAVNRDNEPPRGGDSGGGALSFAWCLLVLASLWRRRFKTDIHCCKAPC